jgi:integrase
MAGVDLLTVTELLGHKTLKMTLRYAHLSPSHKAKAISVLEEALGHEPTIQKLDTPTKKASAHES